MDRGLTGGAGMKACSHQKENLVLHLYGELDPAARKEVENHLDSCPGCRQERVRLHSLQQLLRKTASVPELTPQETRALVTAVKSKLNRPRTEKWWRRYLDVRPARLIPAIATACLVIITAGIIGYVKYNDTNELQLFFKKHPQGLMVSDKDLEILKNLDFLKEMDAIQKLSRVVDVNIENQPQGDINGSTRGMRPYGYRQAVV
jgi:hypothetical protein